MPRTTRKGKRTTGRRTAFDEASDVMEDLEAIAAALASMRYAVFEISHWINGSLTGDGPWPGAEEAKARTRALLTRASKVLDCDATPEEQAAAYESMLKADYVSLFVGRIVPVAKP